MLLSVLPTSCPSVTLPCDPLQARDLSLKVALREHSAYFQVNKETQASRGQDSLPLVVGALLTKVLNE